MPCMKKGFQRGAWSSGDSGEGMLRYEEGLLVESFSRRPEGFTVDHLGRRESCFTEVEVRGARLSTWVVMLQEVPRLR